MRKTLLVCMLCTIVLAGCSSKKSDPTPTSTKHTIKVTANAAQQYSTGVWVKKKDETVLGTPLDAKTVTGNYEFTTTAEVGQKVVYELQSNTDADLSYSIVDNGTVATSNNYTLHNNSISVVYEVK